MFEGKKLYSPIISTDEIRVQQVLLGLFSNALKFTKHGGIKINVSIDSEIDTKAEQNDDYEPEA